MNFAPAAIFSMALFPAVFVGGIIFNIVNGIPFAW